MEIFKHEGIDRVNLDGQMFTVYEYRPVASAPHKLVVKYGNLFFTVGKSSAASPGASNGASGSESSTIADLTQQLLDAQIRIDAISNGTHNDSGEKAKQLAERVKMIIEREREISTQRLAALEQLLMETISSTLGSSSSPSHSNVNSQPSSKSTTPAPENQKQTPKSTPVPVPPQIDDWSLAPEQRLVFEALFDQTDTNKSGKLSGPQVKEILSRSQLPNPTLAQIWALASINKDIFLNKAEFCIAMYITSKVVHQTPIPSSTPPALIATSGFQESRKSSPQGHPPVEDDFAVADNGSPQNNDQKPSSKKRAAR